MRKAAVLIIGGLALSLICTAQSGKIETLGPLTDTSVPDAIRQTLDSKGYRVLLDESTPACELMATQKRACPTEEGLSRRHLHATCRVHVRWHLALPENWQRFSRAGDPCRFLHTPLCADTQRRQPPRHLAQPRFPAPPPGGIRCRSQCDFQIPGSRRSKPNCNRNKASRSFEHGSAEWNSTGCLQRRSGPLDLFRRHEACIRRGSPVFACVEGSGAAVVHSNGQKPRFGVAATPSLRTFSRGSCLAGE